MTYYFNMEDYFSILNILLHFRERGQLCQIGRFTHRTMYWNLHPTGCTDSDWVIGN